MQKTHKNIAKKFLVVLLSFILLIPICVKLNHLFEDHKHEVCVTPFSNHIHEIEIDCEFYDFTLNTNFYQSISDFELFEIQENYQILTSQYHFLNDYQQLQFSLRGPPSSV